IHFIGNLCGVTDVSACKQSPGHHEPDHHLSSHSSSSVNDCNALYPRSQSAAMTYLRTFLVVAGFAFTTTVDAADAEHMRLTAMTGTWDIEMTFVLRPGGPAIATKGTSTIRPLLNGLFIEE